jgi:hypothetical protein
MVYHFKGKYSGGHNENEQKDNKGNLQDSMRDMSRHEIQGPVKENQI